MSGHYAKVIAQPTGPHGVIRWGWRCCCGVWAPCTMSAREATSDRTAHELYPNGVGDADRALRGWARR